MRYKYDYDKHVRKKRVFEVNKLVHFDRLPLAVGTNNLKETDKLTYNKVPPRADGSYGIIIVKLHTLTIEENKVRNKI